MPPTRRQFELRIIPALEGADAVVYTLVGLVFLISAFGMLGYSVVAFPTAVNDLGFPLAIIGLIPMVAFAMMNVSSQIPFGGTSLLIMVGVGLDTVKQIESQLQQRNYEGFLR